MAAELITPVDEVSGIPLPILPQELLPSDNPAKANWHHPWHASSAPELQTLGGKALRHSRVQLVRTTDHNEGDRTRGKLTYHDFYIGPKLPSDEPTQFNACVLACAGYIPERAIDLRGDEPAEVIMTREQAGLLRLQAQPRSISIAEILRLRRKANDAHAQQEHPTLTRRQHVKTTLENFQAQRAMQAGFGLHHIVYRYEPMRDFFRSYVMSQDLSHLRNNELKVEEFLLTPNQDRKEHLGRWLLAQAVDKTTDTVRNSYTEMWAAERLHPRMPANANLLVLWKLGGREDRTQLVVEYEHELKSSLGLVA